MSCTCVECVGYQPEPVGELCGRCGSEETLFESNCEEKPEALLDVPLGMYHCPDCGAMLLAGVPHPRLCRTCIDRTHPRYDSPKKGT